MKLEFDLNEDPGRGNLNLRAFVATIVGGKRLAHAQRNVIQVPRDRGILLARNQPGAQQALYVHCQIPERVIEGAPIVFVSFRFSSSEQMGDSAVLQLLEPVGHAFASFESVLLPNEELYGQFAPGLFPGSPFADFTKYPLVVSKVSF